MTDLSELSAARELVQDAICIKTEPHLALHDASHPLNCAYQPDLCLPLLGLLLQAPIWNSAATVVGLWAPSIYDFPLQIEGGNTDVPFELVYTSGHTILTAFASPIVATAYRIIIQKAPWTKLFYGACFTQQSSNPPLIRIRLPHSCVNIPHGKISYGFDRRVLVGKRPQPIGAVATISVIIMHSAQDLKILPTRIGHIIGQSVATSRSDMSLTDIRILRSEYVAQFRTSNNSRVMLSDPYATHSMIGRLIQPATTMRGAAHGCEMAIMFFAAILGLAYHSAATRASTVGMSWVFKGAPVIERVAATKTRDGLRGIVNYHENDRFALGGQRLIHLSGNEYRYEIEQWAKLVAHDNPTNPTSPSIIRTVVFASSGAPRHNSNIKAAGQDLTRLWALAQQADAFSNYASFKFLNDSSNDSATLPKHCTAGVSGVDGLDASVRPRHTIHRRTSDIWPSLSSAHIVSSVGVGIDILTPVILTLGGLLFCCWAKIREWLRRMGSKSATRLDVAIYYGLFVPLQVTLSILGVAVMKSRGYHGPLLAYPHAASVGAVAGALTILLEFPTIFSKITAFRPAVVTGAGGKEVVARVLPCALSAGPARRGSVPPAACRTSSHVPPLLLHLRRMHLGVQEAIMSSSDKCSRFPTTPAADGIGGSWPPLHLPHTFQLLPSLHVGSVLLIHEDHLEKPAGFPVHTRHGYWNVKDTGGVGGVRGVEGHGGVGGHRRPPTPTKK
ncbi:hypothetical protein FB451DRAFT_1527273 [Mycena latifolia]|nr:hypothetical protein FB451DRAFT_1527273 [Mycena latifolia]